MKKIDQTMLLLGLGLGVLGAVLLGVWAYTYKATLDEEFQGRTVYVFRQDVQGNDRVVLNMLDTKQIPKEYDSLEGEWVKPENLGAVLGQVLSRPVRKGDFLRFDQFKTYVEPIRISQAQEDNPYARPVTIPVNLVTSSAMMLDVGDRVDVVAIYRAQQGGAGGEMVVHTIMSDSDIMAVGNRTRRADNIADMGTTYTTVTLRARDVEEAKKLLAAVRVGEIMLLPRPENASAEPVNMEPQDAYAILARGGRE